MTFTIINKIFFIILIAWRKRSIIHINENLWDFFLFHGILRINLAP